jgi:hypothetical protein
MNMTSLSAKIILLGAIAVQSVCGQGTFTLIGPGVRNGSFEEGVRLPWEGDLQVAHGSGFASEGEWFGSLSELANGNTARAGTWQIVPVSIADGNIFVLQFDVRAGTVGFDSVTVSLQSTSVEPVVTILSAPPLASDRWVTYKVEFVFAETWASEIISPFIQLTKNNAVIGITYSGFLDNVVLQQVPEPSTLMLSLVGCVFLMVCAFRRAQKRYQ